MTYNISVWHNSATEGTHQSKLLSASTKEKALMLFAKELQKPERYRSFTTKNKVFMWSIEHGHIMDIPFVEEVTA